jgi:hypothetical protein
VSLSTPLTRRRSWGFRCALRRFDPVQTGEPRVVHRLGPTCRSSIDRSRWFSRAIGRPVVKLGSAACHRLPQFQCRARTAGDWGKARRASNGRSKGRSIEDRSVRLLGFRVLPSAVGPVPAFVFSGACTSCLGLSPLSGLTDAGRRAFTAAGTYGRKRMLRRVPPFARSRLSRGRIRSWVCVSSVGLAAGPVSNTGPRRLSSGAIRVSTVRRYSETRPSDSPFAADVPSAC